MKCTLQVTDVFPRKEDGSRHELVKKALNLLDNVLAAKQSVEDVEASVALFQIAAALEEQRTHLKSSSQTSQLITMVGISPKNQHCT